MGTCTGGKGDGLRVDVVTDLDGIVTKVTVSTAAAGCFYEVADEVKIAGDEIGRDASHWVTIPVTHISGVNPLKEDGWQTKLKKALDNIAEPEDAQSEDDEEKHVKTYFRGLNSKYIDP